MKKIILFFPLLFVLTLPVLSQSAQEENNIFTDYKYEKCPQEPDAPAVVMFDKGETSFRNTDESFNYIFQRKVRIKILSEAGVKWANIEIPLYNSKNVIESAYNIKAMSYFIEDNKVVKTELNTADCYLEKQKNNWEVMKFAIPKARVGSIIEYSYYVESNYLFNIPDWKFQWEIPVLYSSYKIHMIPFYQYQYSLQGSKKFDDYKAEESTGFERSVFGVKFKDMDYSFVMKNLGSFRNEGFITSINDYIIKLNFQLCKIIFPGGMKKDIITTWPQLIKDLLQDSNFGKYEKNVRKQAKTIFNMEQLSALPEEKRIDSIISYVKKNFIWNNYYSLMANRKIDQFMKDKHGSSAEINLFTIGLLNAAGIPSFPVIISTRNHGKIDTSYPFYDTFNNVLILYKYQGKSILTDATNILLDNASIPTDCINEAGLIIKPVGEKEEWFTIQPQKLSKTRTAIYSAIEGDALKSTISVLASEYDGLRLRTQYGEDKEKILKHLAGENNEVLDSSLIIKNMENASGPYSLRYTVQNRLQKSGNNLYIEPFLREIPSENPFKQVSRTYPVDMVYPYLHSFMSSITIPDGFVPTHLPVDKEFKNEQMEYQYQVKQFDNKIVITFTFAFKKSVYQPGDYSQLKYFYNQIIKVGGEQVILSKK